MRRSSVFPLPLSAPLSLALVALVVGTPGCNAHGIKEVRLEKNQVGDRTLELQANKDVDILFVVDNSGSMAEEQAKLAQNFDRFIGVLERKGVDANYRIGVTTSDNGNVACSGTSPEGGRMRLVSCTERPDEFTWPKSNPQVEAFEEACTSVCPEAVGAGLLVRPTRTANDPELRPRPWIERIEGVSNIEGADTTQAFQCYGPQGVDGCGFEAQLEAQFKAIQRAATTTENQYDFLRDSAILAVVQVTDEADCSANEAHQAEVFSRGLAEEDRVFWEDPSYDAPTSAICWNAGVRCEGAGGVYSRCDAQDYAVDGSEIDDPTLAATDAVLRPVDRYIDQIQAIEDRKRSFDPDREVIVAVLGGVPQGYAQGAADIVYQDAPDPEVQRDFGVDWGCVSSGGGEAQTAVPMVRLREFAEAFDRGDPDRRNIFSICAEDYSPALAAVAEAIEDQVRPACFESCVKDADPSTPEALDPECSVDEFDEGTGARRPVPPCVDGGLPEGAAVCYLTKTADEMHPVCIEGGWNLEFELLRDPAQPPATGTRVSATCQLSDFPEIDCPEL